MLRRRYLFSAHAGIIPDNEIWYTTDDGSVIDIINYDYLPQLVSNVYSNGKGVLSFSGSVNEVPIKMCNTETAVKHLKTVELPSCVSRIGSSAFYSCGYLSQAILHCPVPEAPSSPFPFKRSIYVPDDLVSDYKSYGGQWKYYMNYIKPFSECVWPY